MMSKERMNTSTEMADFKDVDFLTCGSCQKEFPLSNIVTFMRHKKLDCDDGTDTADSSAEFYFRLICQIKDCREQFATAWALLQHVQMRHIPNIFSGLQLYTRGIESIQVQTSQRPAVTYSSGTLTTAQQTGVDVQSLCMLGLGDTFDSISQPDIQEIPVSGKKVDGDFSLSALDGKKVATVSFASTETQTDAMQICTDERCDAANCAGEKCCDDQDCCITIMPGTHEKPKKCCSAIVPKKRKQHMESKHMPSGVSTRSQKRRAAVEQRRPVERRPGDRQYSISSNNDTIYINVTESNMEVSSDYQGNGENVPVHGDPGDKFSQTVAVSSDSLVIDTGSSLQESNGSEMACTGKGSMIIQPGSMVTIPPPTQPMFPVPSVLPSTVTSGKAVISQTKNLTLGTSNSSLPLAFVYDTSLQTSPQLEFSRPDNITSVSSGDGLPKISITSSKPLTTLIPASAANVMQRTEQETNMMAAATGSLHDSTSHGEDTLKLRSGGKKRRYPTSRPFKCEQCGHSFNQRIHLKKHLSKHTGIKPYKCGQCDYSTVERSHLKVHIRIHTGEKPFKCTYCEYATAQNSTLKIHLKRHHSGKETSNSVCEKNFSESVVLNDHHENRGGTHEQAAGKKADLTSVAS